MFSITEAVIGLAILAVVLAGLSTMRSDLTVAGEAERAASVVETVHAAAERYLDDRYLHIERCLNGAQWAARWRVLQRAVLAAGGTGTRPLNTGSFVSVALYPDDVAGTAVAGDPAYPGRAAAHANASLGVGPLEACLPSLAAAGFLPAGLSGLRVSTGDPWAHVLADRYDLRLVARLVQLDPDLDAWDPVLGVQMLLVLKTPDGEPLPYRLASAVAERTGLAAAGVFASIASGGADAESTLAGFGGGWRLDVCVPTAGQVSAQRAIVAGLGSSYVPDPSGHAGFDRGNAGALGSLGVPDCDDPGAGVRGFGDLRTVPVGSFDDPLFSAFARPAAALSAAYERLSGARASGGATAPAAGRVVALVVRSRDAAMRNVLHREAVAGFPELQRMEADVDMGAYGFTNVGFVAGVDTDGDGLVNQGVQVVGPAPPHLWDEALGPQPGYLPTTFHGPVHFRGPVVIHDGEYPLRADFAAAVPDVREDNFQAGTLVVSGPTFLGPDPQTVLDGSALRATNDGVGDWAYPALAAVDRRVFGPGALRVRASSDSTFDEDTALGAVSLHAGQVSVGAFSPEPFTGPGSYPIAVPHPMTSSGSPLDPDVVGGLLAGSWEYPAGLHPDQFAVPAAAVSAMAHWDTLDARAPLQLFSAAPDAPVLLASTGADSAVLVVSAGAGSPVRVQSLSDTSSVSLATFGEKSPLQVVSVAQDSDLQLATVAALSRLWADTAGAGVDAGVLVSVSGADSTVDVVSTDPTGRIAIAAAKADALGGSTDTLPSQATDAPALDVGTWAADARLALHTEDSGAHVDVYTRDASALMALAQGHVPGRASALAAGTIAALDVGTWSADSRLGVHSEAGRSPVDIFTKRRRSSIAVAQGHSSGALSQSGLADLASLELSTWSQNSSAQLRTVASGSPIDVRTTVASSKIAVSQGYTARRSGLTARDIEIGAAGSGASVDVHSGGGGTLALYGRGPSSKVVLAQGVSGHAPESLAAAAAMDLAVVTDRGGDVIVASHAGGNVVLDPSYESFGYHGAGLHLDPDETRFHNPAEHSNTELTLASALGGVAFSFAPGPNYPTDDRGPVDRCPPGTVHSSVVVPTGWSRGDFAAVRTVTITLSVGSASDSVAFDLHEPYTGWSVHPVSGADDGVGADSSAGNVDWTRINYCRTT